MFCHTCELKVLSLPDFATRGIILDCITALNLAIPFLVAISILNTISQPAPDPRLRIIGQLGNTFLFGITSRTT